MELLENGYALSQFCVGSPVDLSCGLNPLSAHAVDRAGNASAPVTRVITRVCKWTSGVLSPISSRSSCAAGDLEAFKIGRTLPVKFQVYNDVARSDLLTAPPIGSYAKIELNRCDSSTDGILSPDTLPPATANSDGRFRWTGAPDHQYVYNLGTSGKALGTYAVRLTLYDGDGVALAQSAHQFFVLK